MLILDPVGKLYISPVEGRELAIDPLLCGKIKPTFPTIGPLGKLYISPLEGCAVMPFGEASEAIDAADDVRDVRPCGKLYMSLLEGYALIPCGTATGEPVGKLYMSLLEGNAVIPFRTFIPTLEGDAAIPEGKLYISPLEGNAEIPFGSGSGDWTAIGGTRRPSRCLEL